MNAKSVFILKLLLPVALAALLLTAIFWNRRPGATAGAVGEKGVSAPEQSESVPTPIPQPFPTTPPDAGKITVSDANDEGYATVIGVAGAVDPSSTVAVMNLSAHTMMTTTADAGGAFSLDLYAPHGSSLLIKYEPGGFRISHFWKLAITSLADSTTENLNPLPGTNLHVGQPPLGDGKSQRFSAVGDWRSTTPQGWAGWQLSGTLQVPASGTPAGLELQPGDAMTVTARLRLSSPAINCPTVPTFTVNAGISLRHLFNAEGRSEPWGSWFSSYLSTPTGLPIEHEGGGAKLPLTGVHVTSFACVSDHAAEGALDVPVTIPLTVTEGIYRPELFLTSNVPLGPDVPLVEVWFYSGEEAMLPPVKVGDPAPPRIPWYLLVDYPVNGHQGVQARQDVGQFTMPTRVLFPPHQLVFPRLDERSGQPMVYRLEPGSIWLSSTDRRLPNPPHIPLKFPSGQLMVEVRKPDGTFDQLGPAPIVQSSVRTPTTPGGVDLHEATGQISDHFHLTTMDDAFAYRFDQDGHHTIFVLGEIHDIYGNVYRLDSTYDIDVARVLDLDPAQLPTTPYVQGDAFAPGMHLFPPVPADILLEVSHMPYSDPSQLITFTVSGQANRFGYFQPPAGIEFRFTEPGEFRVDISAAYVAPSGDHWQGAMTWGNVVASPTPLFRAHGRRGMDYKSDTLADMVAWFVTKDLPPEKVGLEVYYPYHSGDIHWGDETPDSPNPTGSIHSVITIEDLTGSNETFYNILRSHFSRGKGFRWPPVDNTLAGLEKRLDHDEAPLFITTQSGDDPAVNPDDIDLWAYYYGSSERPDVRVREIIAEDAIGTPYWRFNDTYGYQIGESADGDLEGDIKWEFGGAVFRLITGTNPITEYDIYSSFWVLLPHNDPESTRVAPPFQDATGGVSFNGGPILTLLGEEIDMLFLPKGVRPGDLLEMGDTISFSGHVGPPLNSQVSVTITSPSGAQHPAVLRANKIGWIYDPDFDFPANEAGRWTVDVEVLHDRDLAYAPAPLTHNSGTVLGTSGRYEFYVVEPGSPRLFFYSPGSGYITWPSAEVVPLTFHGVAPAGTTAVHYTIHDKGVVMGQGVVSPDAAGFFSLTYDAKALHNDFPMLSLTAREGRWEGLADEVAINLLALGGEPRGNTITLIGEEIFIGGPPAQSLYLPAIQR